MRSRGLDDPAELTDVLVDVDRLRLVLKHLGRTVRIERHRERDDLLFGRRKHGVRAVGVLLRESEFGDLALDLDRIPERLSVALDEHGLDVAAGRDQRLVRAFLRDHDRLLADDRVTDVFTTELVRHLSEVLAFPREVGTRRVALRVQDEGREAANRTLHVAVLVEHGRAELAEHLVVTELGALEAVAGRGVPFVLAERRDERDRLLPFAEVLVEFTTRKHCLLRFVDIPAPLVVDREERGVAVLRLRVDADEDRLRHVGDLRAERVDHLIERTREQDEGDAAEGETLFLETLTHLETPAKDYGLSTSVVL